MTGYELTDLVGIILVTLVAIGAYYRLRKGPRQ